MVQVLHHRNVAAALEWTEQVLAAIGDGPDTADLRLTRSLTAQECWTCMAGRPRPIAV